MEHPPRRPANPESFCLSSSLRDLMSSPHLAQRCSAVLGFARLGSALLGSAGLGSGDLMSYPHFAQVYSALLGSAGLCSALGT